MRAAYDYYSTPEWCYKNLPIVWENYKTAIEPCAGDGRIVRFLKDRQIVTDFCEIREGYNFFEFELETKVDLILTNPPYSNAQRFVEKSLYHADTVIMLLRINFLGSQKRKSFWLSNEPDTLFVLSKRPSFTGKGTDSTEYAWYVWQQEEKFIKPGIYHI